ncbi:hypothetical protein [Nodularia sp. NIES-3585]|uniref:hypothetical protein n=1 Tax=Nodularia sp. NIES-3585 TaxID=1973477 RepID=UPI000B5CE25E|nr:hypothetical protein [Nodularia sp. NIES-3585]GAX38735.1 hypothetical protein NIES3585_47870 [Nodularia sp. NIES-3585]
MRDEDDENYEAVKRVGDRVGWSMENRQFKDSHIKVKYTTSTLPGHLPLLPKLLGFHKEEWRDKIGHFVYVSVDKKATYLFERLEETYKL